MTAPCKKKQTVNEAHNASLDYICEKNYVYGLPQHKLSGSLSHQNGRNSTATMWVKYTVEIVICTVQLHRITERWGTVCLRARYLL